jgi:hypothetical protein
MANRLSRDRRAKYRAMCNRSLALIAVMREDRAEAARLYGELTPSAGQFIPGGCSGTAIDRILGLLSVTLAHVQRALRHYHDAYRFCKASGLLPELAARAPVA